MPVGMPVVFEVTVAVKVTDCPWFDGDPLDTTDVEVPAWFTWYDNADEVLPLKLESPL